MRLRTALLTLLLLLLTPLAHADEQVIGLGTTTWTRNQTVTTTDACFIRATGSTDCVLVPAGDSAEHRRHVLTVIAQGAARVCLVGDPASTIGADLEVTGGDANGRGACHQFPSGGGRWDTVVDRRLLLDSGAGGMVSGLCSTAVSTTHGEARGVYAPCSSSCTAYGGGSCVAAASQTTTQIQGAALFLVGRSDSGSVTITVKKERITR